MDTYHFISYSARISCRLAPIGIGRWAKPSAIATYRVARDINKDTGIVKRVLRLFDALAVVDTEGLLLDVRSAAAGE